LSYIQFNDRQDYKELQYYNIDINGSTANLGQYYTFTSTATEYPIYSSWMGLNSSRVILSDQVYLLNYASLSLSVIANISG